MSKIKDVTENFNEFISNGVAVVDFWANWCGPCRMLAPIIDDVADTLSDVNFGKVDVDQAQELARKYNVMSIPNVCIFKNGELVDRVIGLCDGDELAETIKKYL